MSLSERLAAVDRLQRSRGFKVAASIAIGVVTLGLFAAVLVSGLSAEQAVNEATTNFDAITAENATAEDLEQFQALADSGKRAVDLLNRVKDTSGGTVGLAVGILTVGGVLVLATWVGLLLTFAGLAAGVALVAVPLWFVPGMRDWSKFVAGVAILSAVFTTFFQGLRAVFSLPGAVFAVARNVLAEAVRMRLSVVFIVIMLIGLAALPAVLDPDSPLRYRVQSFLAYGSGGTFWIIALLTVTFGVATVAFEQRDRVIWQTMTKPVAPWEYVLGKWLGVSGLAAALLAVNSAGVFLFTEYLRQQPALGEKEAFISQGEANAISEDRLILETQVLTARTVIENEYPEIDRDEVLRVARERALEAARRDTSLRTPREIEIKAAELAGEIAENLEKQILAGLKSIDRGDFGVFVFPNVGQKATSDGPVVLKYRLDSGSNAPDITYRVSVSVAGKPYIVRPIALGVTHTLPIAPLIELPNRTVVTLDDPAFEPLAKAIRDGEAVGRYVTIEELVEDDGTLAIQLVNGDTVSRRMNAERMFVPNGGLKVSVAVGSYRANFLRVVGVLWLKLAFLAMLAVTAATFLSFPVALLIAGGAFLVAEAAPFIGDAVDNFATAERDGTIVYYKVVASYITRAVHWVFSTYGELRPTNRLVTGEMLSWASVGKAVGVLGLWTGVLGVVAMTIFRRRELATYSGR